MRSPFSRKGSKKNSGFTNGPSHTERSVWIGATTLVGQAPRINRESAVESSSCPSTNPSSSSEMLSSDHNDKDNTNNSQPRPKKSSLIKRIKSLSPRREAETDDDADKEDIFFSPDSIPPASDSYRKMKKRSSASVSIGGETIFGESTSSPSSSSNRRTSRRSHVTARRKRSSSSSNSNSHKLFGSVDVPSRALTLSSLEEDGGSSDARVEEGVDLEAALIPRHADGGDYSDDLDSRQIATAPSCIGNKRKQFNEGQRRISSAEGHSLSNRGNDVKRPRLSKRARTRLTMREVNSHIQPGRSDSLLDESMGALEKRKVLTLPKTIDFFLRIEIKLIAVNVMISALLTVLVLKTFPDTWQTGLKESSRAVSLLGAFLSFALVFRTQSCYSRWWEARTMWGKMTATSINLAGQCVNWLEDEELIDRFLTHLIIFPYACKAVLRGNALTSSSEEGPRFLQSGLLTDADLGVIVRHGLFPPFTCIDIMRRTMFEALFHSHPNRCNQRRLPSEALSGAYISMEDDFQALGLEFGACAKIASTGMPSSYTIFMRSFVFFFFVLASLSWAPTTKYLTPILVGFCLFLTNTVIVIGDQMMRPFTFSWAALPIQKYAVMIEREILSVSRRQADINRLR